MTPRRFDDEYEDEDRILTHNELCRKVLELSKRHNKIFEDLYEGADKDNPSIITRLYMIEKHVADQVRIKWLLAAAVLGLFFDIIKSFFKF